MMRGAREMCTDFMGVWTGKWVAWVAFRLDRAGRRCLESVNEVAKRGLPMYGQMAGVFFIFLRF